jgi:hypothetical protein
MPRHTILRENVAASLLAGNATQDEYVFLTAARA